MGCSESVGIDKYPKQGRFLHYRVRVCFHYDTSRVIEGTMVRNDMEEPYLSIIKLDDGRYIMSTECQFQPIRPETTEE